MNTTTVKPIGSSANQIIIPRINEAARVEIVVMKYTKYEKDRVTGVINFDRSWTTIRLPTETSEGGEGFFNTLIRGAKTEVAKDPKNFEVNLWRTFPVYAEFHRDEKNPGFSHVKMAHVLSYESGELRDFQKFDDEDKDELHGPMMWVDIGTILNGSVQNVEVLKSHGKSINAFLKELAKGIDEVEMRYHNFIDRNFRGNPMTADEYHALSRFLGTEK